MLKLLFVNTWLHDKNLYALQKYNLEIDTINHTNLNVVDLSKYDAIYSPTTPIDTSKYPNSKFIFGPHFSVFPVKQQIDMIKQSKNVIYIQPSKWVVELWKNFDLCDSLRLKELPFGVDTDKFNEKKHINKKDLVFIYHKDRDPNELEFVCSYLNMLKISYKVFSYKNRYSEQEYLNYLQNSKYGIWIGRHESQGFALEEALSCNVPLLVWNVVLMNQEIGGNYDDIYGTSIPYWSDKCGMSFTDFTEFGNCYYEFIKNLNYYEPRKYIVDNLSIEKCSDRFIEIINLLNEN